jgi:hypothetical protein
MTPEEIGLIILKMQEDDIRIPEMRSFYKSLATNEAMRRNAALVGRLSTLNDGKRLEYCRAGILFCLASSDIAPGTKPAIAPSVKTHSSFSVNFSNQALGPWRAHMLSDNTKPVAIKRQKVVPTIYVSEELAQLLRAIQDLWNCPDNFV